MTISIAWVRKFKDAEELIFATDSRLRAGYAWDVCPKIMTLPRSDCAICYAGNTFDAYPLILQMSAAIDSYPKSRDRAMDIAELKTHTLKIFNDMRKNIHDLPVGQNHPNNPDVLFILGGYSWIKKEFQLWKLKFNLKTARYEYSTMLKNTKTKVAIIGDYVGEFKKRLNKLKKERNWTQIKGLDMEPFEVLRDMLLENQEKNIGVTEKFPLIGGAPQIVKIYQHLNSRPMGVYWPDRKGKNRVHLFGRPLLNYENTNWWALDPFTLRSSHSHYTNKKKDAK